MLLLHLAAALKLGDKLDGLGPMLRCIFSGTEVYM